MQWTFTTIAIQQTVLEKYIKVVKGTRDLNCYRAHKFEIQASVICSFKRDCQMDNKLQLLASIIYCYTYC